MPNLIVGLVAVGVILINLVFTNTSFALAKFCPAAACPAGATIIDAVSNLDTSCSVTDTTAWGSECLRYCYTCKSGYTKTAVTYANTECSNSTTVYKCVSNSSGGDDDDDDTGGGSQVLTCSASTYTSGICGTSFVNTISNCSSSTSYCFGAGAVKTCDTCMSGYSKSATTVSVTGCSNKFSYNTCVKETTSCTTDADCGTSTDWSSGIGGRQSKTTYTCGVFKTCQTSTSYRCAPGYYDENGNGESISIIQLSCTACPSPGTSDGGTKNIYNCYVPSGVSITDDTGTYEFTEDCSYKMDLVLP